MPQYDTPMPGKKPDPDAELIAELQNDQPGAFEKLFHRYWRMIMALALSHLDNTADAEDAAIETFADIARGIKKFRGESRLSTWLVRIALNRISKHRRQQNRNLNTISLDDCPEHALTTPPLETEFNTRTEIAKIHQDLKRLPRSQREPIILRHILGFTPDEISLTLKIPKPVVAMRINRGIKRLRQLHHQRRGRKK